MRVALSIRATATMSLICHKNNNTTVKKEIVGDLAHRGNLPMVQLMIISVQQDI
jgi:hypothetical protein